MMVSGKILDPADFINPLVVPSGLCPEGREDFFCE